MSWFKKPVNIAITIGAGVLALAALLLIVWGVTHHAEGGLLRVCWIEGEARYVAGVEKHHGTCTGAEELVWPAEQIPLTITPLSVEGQLLGEDAPQTRALAHAVTDLNRQLRFELYRLVTGLDAPDAQAHFGGALEAGGAGVPPGYVRHVRMGNILRGHLYIRSDVVADTRLFHLVLVHELAHLAGLEHDDFPLSIMYPLTRDEWPAGKMSGAYVTDRDIKLLQTLYRRP